MADYSVIKFLGASVSEFSCSMGWNDEASRLQVRLVEDEDDGDIFSPPEVGLPVFFNADGWEFAGLLEQWSDNRTVTGNPIYDVSVVDPRQILEGVTVIMDDYYGPANVPNVINAYGYLENLFGFGGSGRNDSGIPYYLLLQTIMTLGNLSLLNAYTGDIAYKTTKFGIDLTNIPLLGLDYRVGGSTTMSLMDILRDICDAGGCDMFFRMYMFRGLPIIKLYTISRINIPNIGSISQFVSQTNGASIKESGFEMVNDTCAKMVFGGKRTQLYFQGYSGGDDVNEDTGIDNTIWPYWGTDIDGTLVVGNLTGYHHNFRLDSRGVGLPNVGPWYYTDVGEMMAALGGYGDWIGFLTLNWANEYYLESNGTQTAQLQKFTGWQTINGIRVPQFSNSSNTYQHNGNRNPHFMKIFNLGVTPSFDLNILDLLLSNNNTLPQIGYSRIMSNIPGVGSIDPIEELWRMISEFAGEHYGRKFMVRVPEIGVKVDPDTLKVEYSMLPTDSAFLDDPEVLAAMQNSLMPLDFNGITNEDNRIVAYARFDNTGTLDFTDIPPEDIFFANNGNSIFVKVQVEPELVFLDRINYLSPRVVITLPAPIGINRQLVDDTTPIWWSLRYMVDVGQLTNTQQGQFMKKLYHGASLIGNYISSRVPIAQTPNMAAVPLELQTELYGPWYIATSIGKTEVEHNESLVPWNYGSSALMNAAGIAQVNSLGVQLQTMEYGSVEYPGIPALQLGDQLLASGPYVTDINVSVSPGGITTRYALKSWTPRYGRLYKYYADKFFKIRKTQYEFARRIRDIRRRIRK